MPSFEQVVNMKRVNAFKMYHTHSKYNKCAIYTFSERGRNYKKNYTLTWKKFSW